MNRAATAVGRPVPDDTSDIVRDWGALRSVRLSSPGKLPRLRPSWEKEVGAEAANINSVAVLLSLDGRPLLRDVPLCEGEDICLDGEAAVVFVGKEGAHAILFILEM